MNENHHHHLKKRHLCHADHDHTRNGFIEKLINDVKKIYNYEKYEIKFKNERPAKSKAYEPTEVRKKINYRFSMRL